MIEHGEQILDVLGGEVDRIEKEIKVRTYIASNSLSEWNYLYEGDIIDNNKHNNIHSTTIGDSVDQTGEKYVPCFSETPVLFQNVISKVFIIVYMADLLISLLMITYIIWKGIDKKTMAAKNNLVFAPKVGHR